MNKKKIGRNQSGQAFVEMILVLPVLFFIIIFSLQIFSAIYEAQGKQQDVRTRIMSRINYLANGGVNAPSRIVDEVTSQRIKTLGIPIFGLQTDQDDSEISIRLGICKNKGC